MPTIDRRDIFRLLGPVADHTAVEIMNLGPTVEDVELAALRLAQEDDAVSEAHKTLTGFAAQIFDIASRDALYAEDREPERGSAS